MFYAVINYQFKTSELRTANNAQNTQHKLGVAFSYLERKKLFHTKCLIQFYHMAESVFAMWLVNLRSVTCYTDQNF